MNAKEKAIAPLVSKDEIAEMISSKLHGFCGVPPLEQEKMIRVIASMFAEQAALLKDAKEALEKIKSRAKSGRDWNLGHFCESRSHCQSIVDLSDDIIAKLKSLEAGEMKFNGRCERHGEAIVTSDGKCDLCLSGQLWTAPCPTCSKPTALMRVSKCTAYTADCMFCGAADNCDKKLRIVHTELTPTEAVEVLKGIVENWNDGSVMQLPNGDRIEVEK